MKLNKGDFIAREALLRIKGLTRKLVPITLEGDTCVLYGGGQ